MYGALIFGLGVGSARRTGHELEALQKIWGQIKFVYYSANRDSGNYCTHCFQDNELMIEF